MLVQVVLWRIPYEDETMVFAVTELDKVERITAGLMYAEHPTNKEVIEDLEENINIQKQKTQEI